MSFVSTSVKLAKAAALAICLLVTLTLTINLDIFDEEVLPEVSELLKAKPKPPIEGNAYYNMLGLEAPVGVNPNTHGRDRIHHFEQRPTKGSINAGSSDSEFLGMDTDWLKKHEGCNPRKQSGCLAHFTAQLEHLNSTKLHLLFKRYDDILLLSKFTELDHTNDAFPLPDYGTFIRINQLKIAQAYQSDDSTLFLQQVTASMNFWKLMLVQADSLIAKMIAVAGLWYDLSALSAFISNQESVVEIAPELERMLAPLSQVERDIGETFIFELRYAANLIAKSYSADQDLKVALSVLQEIEIKLSGLLFQPNATTNYYYQEVTKPIMALSQLPASDFILTIGTAQARKAHKVQMLNKLPSLSPTNLYNPIGKLGISGTYYALSDYIGRIHDVDGIMALIKLQIMLKQSDITTAALKGYTLASGIPIQFDPEAQTLSFECLDPHADCKIEI